MRHFTASLWRNSEQSVHLFSRGLFPLPLQDLVELNDLVKHLNTAAKVRIIIPKIKIFHSTIGTFSFGGDDIVSDRAGSWACS